MTNQSLSRRLRLFLLSLSLFCLGAAAAQLTPRANQPPGVSVLEYRYEKHTAHGMMFPQPTPVPVGEVNEGVPNRSVNWPQGGSSYFYYIQIRNEGPKVIRSMTLDYVFDDVDSNTELGRRSLNCFEKIDLNKTKWIEVRAFPLGPPKVATVEGIKKDRRSPFDEHVEIKCVLYADGTGWKSPNAESKTCDELVRLTLHPDARRN